VQHLSLVLISVVGLATVLAIRSLAPTPLARQMERLGRGIVALRVSDSEVFVSWRLLATDPDDLAFNLYRRIGNAPPIRLNSQPLTQATCWLDKGVNFHRNQPITYLLRSVRNGKELPATVTLTLSADMPIRPYLAIPMRQVPGDDEWAYAPNDGSVGDLDGDGEYELVVKREMDGFDPAQNGICRGTTKLEAYKLDGTFLWRIDLGPNIRSGAHYTPFLAYDFGG